MSRLVADTTRTFPDAEQKLRTLGYYPIQNARTRQVMPVARSQFDDGLDHDVLRATTSIHERPLLIVHGRDDEAVPEADARALAGAHGNAELLLLEGAGHTFGCVHPFAGSTPATVPPPAPTVKMSTDGTARS